MTIESLRPHDLSLISSYSRLILDLSNKSLIILHAAVPTLEALSQAAAEVHTKAADSEAGDVLGLLVAVGRAEEALAPLTRLSATAQSGLDELREALHLPVAPDPA